MGNTSEPWEARSKCLELSVERVDSLFFPGSGGKPHKADAYCASCPVLSMCLTKAIVEDLEGFYAGTTRDQRRHMAAFRQLAIIGLMVDMPEEPDRSKRVVYRKVFTSPDTHSYLDELDDPDPLDLLKMEAELMDELAATG